MGYETYQHAEKNLYKEINSRISDPSREVVLAPFGNWSTSLTKINKAALIESGIGYNGVFATYRCFESYAWQHTHLGMGNSISDPNWFHSVIPGYVDPKEFSYSNKKDDYFLFVGRIMERKGMFIAEQLAREFNKKIVVAGNGDTSWMANKEYIEYVGVVGVEEKKELYKNAAATLCLTQYTEPFGNVHIESMISGTPVITTDWGVYTETVPQGKVGWRGRTWEDHKYGIENLDKIDPQMCRDWAMANFSLDSVYPAFEQYFEKCAAHFVSPTKKSSSWYFERDNYEDFIWNYQKKYDEHTRVHIYMVCNNPFVSMALKSLRSFSCYHSNYDITIIDSGLSLDNKKKFRKLNGFLKFIPAMDEFINTQDRLHVNDKTLNPTWLKFLMLDRAPKNGTILFLDADTFFLDNINNFLTFDGCRLLHVCNDAVSFNSEEYYNLTNGNGSTYFRKDYTDIFPNYEKYKHAVTVNAGVVAINLNLNESIELKDKLQTVSKEIYKQVDSWPMEQGVLNHLIYSDYVDKGLVKIFDFTYNTSAYNTHIFNNNLEKNVKLLHYHKPSVLDEFLSKLDH